VQGDRTKSSRKLNVKGGDGARTVERGEGNALSDQQITGKRGTGEKTFMRPQPGSASNVGEKGLKDIEKRKVGYGKPRETRRKKSEGPSPKGFSEDGWAPPLFLR